MTNGINLQQLGELLQGQFQAKEITPVKKPVYGSPPVFDEKLVIGTTSGDVKYYTQLKLWVHKPSEEYPATSILLSLKNAKSSTFTKISIEDIPLIINFLNSCLPVIQEAVSQYQPLADSLSALREQHRREEYLTTSQNRPSNGRFTLPDEVKSKLAQVFDELTDD